MTQKSAHEEPWWDEFVSAYGEVPLRELARRFETNPRRLRRAAQRAGLADEPLAIRKNTALLGKTPDASLAAKLEVTVEQVQGARKRRGIDAFQKNKKKATARRPKRPEAPAPAAPRRVEPTEPVVVSRARLKRSPTSGELPGGRGLGRRLKNLAPSEPEVVTRRAPRRRVVSTERADEVRDKKDEPKPPTPAPVRRRPKSPKPAPVTIVYTKPEPTPVTEPTSVPEPTPAAIPDPEPTPDSKPVAAPEPTPAPQPEPIPARAVAYFRAIYEDGSERIVAAPDLAQAAVRAALEGPLAELVPARVLSPAG